MQRRGRERRKRIHCGVNHDRFVERLDFIHAVLEQRFGLKAQTVSPMNYDPNYPYLYNNFLYRIWLGPATHRVRSERATGPSLASNPFARPGSALVSRQLLGGSSRPLVASSRTTARAAHRVTGRSDRRPSPAPPSPLAREVNPGPSQPFTKPIPDGLDQLVMRLSNRAADFNHRNHVENQVAFMELARNALKAHSESSAATSVSSGLIPVVYGWGSASGGQGWILQAFMPGRRLDHSFAQLAHDDQRYVLKQIAEVVFAFQTYPLPTSIQQYGGLSILSDGILCSDSLAEFGCGPFHTYEDMFKGIFRRKLARADLSEVLQGWRPRGIRTRLENFLSEDLNKILEGIASNGRSMVHGHLTPNNLLFDQRTNLITAVLDFDYGRIACIGEEFLYSFKPIGGCMPGPRGQSNHDTELRKAMLQGVYAPIEDMRMAAAATWDSCLSQVGAAKPSTIASMDELSELHWLSEQICPSTLYDPGIVTQRKTEELDTERAIAEKLLDEYLTSYGY